MKKARKLTSIALALLMLISVFAVAPMTASAMKNGDYYYSVLDGGTAEITGYIGSATELTFPSELGGYTVTSIGECAFENSSSITSVTIPDGVVSIGDSAFQNCESLSIVTIPDSVTNIDGSAFSGCTSLTSVTIPDSVKKIGSQAFSRCTSLISVNIPDGVLYVGFDAFNKTAYYNNETNWENGVLYIGHHLIKAKESVTDNCTIKEGTLTIAGRAFEGCTNLTSVTIPDSVTSIKEVFYECRSLTSVTIPDSVTSIEGAFYGCTSLTSVTIPDNVTSIGKETFSGCTSLTSVTIPDCVTNIEYSAFYECSSLTSVTIPDSVKRIDPYAFCGCTNLTSVTIPDSVTWIGTYAFCGCTSLTSVTISESVSGIDLYALGYISEWDEETYEYNYKLIDGFKIYGYTDSEAERYAKNNKIPFISIGAVIKSISDCAVTGIKAKTYNGKDQTQSVTVKDGDKKLTKGTDYTVSYKNNKNAGTATMTIKGKGSYTGSVKKTFKINKAANPMTVKATAKTVKYSTVKKKNVAVTAVTVKNAQGTKSFKKTSGNKNITINAKTGKLTVKKGTKKSTYTIKVQVTAKGNSNYKSASKTVTVKVKVK